jgi:5'-nucleotidase
MGRETKLLLAVLASLTGAFLGALSLKLLVPRPPAGAGPDVDPGEAVAVRQIVVDPPSLTLPAMPTMPSAEIFASAPEMLAPRRPLDPAPVIHDPEVRPSGLEAPVNEPAVPAAEPIPSDLDPPPARDLPPPAVVNPTANADRSDAEPAVLEPTAPRVDLSPAEPAPLAGSHITQPGDSWWSLAERAYGDGRFYRPLFAWNRSLDPRVSVAPGTRIDIPPLSRLQAALPALMPR